MNNKEFTRYSVLRRDVIREVGIYYKTSWMNRESPLHIET